MRIKQIEVGLSGVIPLSSYQNLRPSFNMVIELVDGDSEEGAFKLAQERLRELFEGEANRAKVDLVEKEYQNIRFYEHNGKKFPSVTSILSWDTDWKITADELNQYASRGTIIHKLIEIYLKDKKWVNPLDVPELSKEVSILMTGSKKLSWIDCSYQKAVESLMPDIEIVETEKKVVSETHLFAGRLDLLAKYKGKLAVLDFKSGSTTDLRQVSAYASCVDKVEVIGIIPVGQTDNKSGFKKPIISEDVGGEFKEFLKARKIFRERFGI